MCGRDMGHTHTRTSQLQTLTRRMSMELSQYSHQRIKWDAFSEQFRDTACQRWWLGWDVRGRRSGQRTKTRRVYVEKITLLINMQLNQGTESESCVLIALFLIIKRIILSKCRGEKIQKIQLKCDHLISTWCPFTWGDRRLYCVCLFLLEAGPHVSSLLLC